MLNTKEKIKMKKIVYILTFVAAAFFYSCEQGIDPITVVQPGVDEAVPVVSFVSLTVGSDTKNKLGSDVVTFNVTDTVSVDFKVVDDIELASVTVTMNDEVIATYTDFLDYRRFIESLTFNDLGLGDYTLKVDVLDTDGNAVQSILQFKKASPYTRYTSNEIAYYPLDGTWQDMIQLGYSTPNGTVFAGVGKVGDNSIYSPYGTHLNVPADNLKNSEISGSFWYFPTSTPKKAAIITCGAGLDDLNYGFRLYREGSPSSQILILSVGLGTGEVKNNKVIINPLDSTWRHIGFTISATEATIYVDGVAKNTVALSGPIDWTGCETMAVGGGGESFSYSTDQSKIDELRFFDKALNATEMADVVTYKGGATAAEEYTPLYDGEVLFMNYTGGSMLDLVAAREITVVGSPTSASPGKIGDAYAGAEGASLELELPDEWKTNEFSAAFWVNVNAVPDRAGILSVGNPALIGADNPRLNGFRLFREGTVTSQRLKVNVGMGDADTWNDGIDITNMGEWVHVAVAISADKLTLYVNGVKGSLNNVENGYAALAAPISWDGCSKIELFTGGTTFAYWSHASDLSLFDELRFFNKALTDAEVQTIYDAEK